MAETFGTRLGLINWGAGTDGPSRAEFNQAFSLVEQKAVVFAEGTLAARPAAGTVFRFYRATDVGRLFLDTGAAWIEIALVGPNTVPVGAVMWYPAGDVPTFYLRGDGAAVSRTTYADLFAKYGTSFGAGDGATTFNLPALGGRRLVGVDATHALATLGADTHLHALNFNSGLTTAGHGHPITGNSENLTALRTGVEPTDHQHTGVTAGGANTGARTAGHDHAVGHAHGPGGYQAGGQDTDHRHLVAGNSGSTPLGAHAAGYWLVKALPG